MGKPPNAPETIELSPTAIKSLFKYYLDTQIKGGWIDQVDVYGKAITNVMPTSTFYHLFSAASEVAGYVDEKE